MNADCKCLRGLRLLLKDAMQGNAVHTDPDALPGRSA